MTSTDRGRLITAPFALVTLSTFAYFAVGFVVGAFAIAAAVLRPFPGRFGDLRGRRILIVGGSALVGVSVPVASSSGRRSIAGSK